MNFYDVFRKVMNGLGMPTVDNTSAILITVIFGLAVLLILFVVLAILARPKKQAQVNDANGAVMYPYPVGNTTNITSYTLGTGAAQISEQDIMNIIGKLRDNPDLMNGTPKKEEEKPDDKVEQVAIAPVVDSDDDEGDDFVAENGLYVRYDYSFRSRLILAKKEMQDYYVEILDNINSYKKVKVSESWKHQRVSVGRNRLALLFFRGGTLCVTLALNPKNYVDTTYVVEDVSDVKRFDQTPLMVRITSARKVKQVLELFGDVAEKNELVHGEVEPSNMKIPYKSKNQLISLDLIKVNTNATNLDELRAAKFNLTAVLAEKIHFAGEEEHKTPVAAEGATNKVRTTKTVLTPVDDDEEVVPVIDFEKAKQELQNQVFQSKPFWELTIDEIKKQSFDRKLEKWDTLQTKINTEKQTLNQAKEERNDKKFNLSAVNNDGVMDINTIKQKAKEDFETYKADRNSWLEHYIKAEKDKLDVVEEDKLAEAKEKCNKNIEDAKQTVAGDIAKSQAAYEKKVAEAQAHAGGSKADAVAEYKTAVANYKQATKTYKTNVKTLKNQAKDELKAIREQEKEMCHVGIVKAKDDADEEQRKIVNKYLKDAQDANKEMMAKGEEVNALGEALAKSQEDAKNAVNSLQASTDKSKLEIAQRFDEEYNDARDRGMQHVKNTSGELRAKAKQVMNAQLAAITAQKQDALAEEDKNHQEMLNQLNAEHKQIIDENQAKYNKAKEELEALQKDAHQKTASIKDSSSASAKVIDAQLSANKKHIKQAKVVLKQADKEAKNYRGNEDKIEAKRQADKEKAEAKAKLAAHKADEKAKATQIKEQAKADKAQSAEAKAKAESKEAAAKAKADAKAKAKEEKEAKAKAKAEAAQVKAEEKAKAAKAKAEARAAKGKEKAEADAKKQEEKKLAAQAKAKAKADAKSKSNEEKAAAKAAADKEKAEAKAKANAEKEAKAKEQAEAKAKANEEKAAAKAAADKEKAEAKANAEKEAKADSKSDGKKK